MSQPTEQPSQIPPSEPPYNQQPGGQYPHYPQQPPTGYYQQPQGYYQQPPQYMYNATRPMPIKQSHPLMMVFAIIGIVVVALIAIGVIIGIAGGSKPVTTNNVQSSVNSATGSTANPAEAAPKLYHVGDTVKAGGYLVTLNAIDRSDGFSEYFKAGAGKTMLAIDITIESTKDSGVSANQFYCKLRDSQGYQYNLTVAGKDPSLGSQNDIPAGQKLRGWVTFEVPKTANGFVFSYEPLSLSQRISIPFDLGQ
jgi:hypothetical protein